MPTRKDRETRTQKRRRYERAARLYLQSCYTANTAARVTEFASFVGLTRPHLSSEMKLVFGVPPLAFLRDLQLEHACWLLRATPARPAKIAQAAAFGTVNTFYRVFAARYGMSPDRYREMNRTK
jgi:AraC-like DNA-binding protein